LLLALLVAPLGSAQAAPISFGFLLQFSSGPLSGQSFAGTFSVDGDDCAGPCSGTFAPATDAKTLLSFDVTVGGTSFAMTDDLLYDSYPRVGFLNDVVTSVDYASNDLPESLTIQFGLVSQERVVFSTGSETGTSTGTFHPGQGPPVPEPGTLTLLGLGLAGLAATSRRKQ
jgi:hypothetical protein